MNTEKCNLHFSLLCLVKKYIVTGNKNTTKFCFKLDKDVKIIKR